MFFTRGTTERDNTTEVAFYDMRTNMDSFGKTRQLRKSDFDEFVAGYEDPSKRTSERWSKFTVRRSPRIRTIVLTGLDPRRLHRGL